MQAFGRLPFTQEYDWFWAQLNPSLRREFCCLGWTKKQRKNNQNALFDDSGGPVQIWDEDLGIGPCMPLKSRLLWYAALKTLWSKVWHQGPSRKLRIQSKKGRLWRMGFNYAELRQSPSAERDQIVNPRPVSQPSRQVRYVRAHVW